MIARINKVVESIGIVSKTTNSNTSTSTSQQSGWEAFTRVKGFLTDFINAPINIPSTIITPSFQLPSKAAFSQVTRCIGYASALLNVVKEVDAVINGKEVKKKQQEIIRNNVAKGFNK